MNSTLTPIEQLLPLERLRSVLRRFSASIEMGCLILNGEGAVVFESAWCCSRVCRQTTSAAQPLINCVKSHITVGQYTSPESTTFVNTCDNGLHGISAPVIIEGRHVVTLYIGPFHLASTDDEQGERNDLGGAGDCGASSIPAVLNENQVAKLTDRLEIMVDLLTEMGKNTILERQSVQQLQNSEERYRKLIDSFPLVVYETDRQGRIIFANNNALEYFDCTQEDIVRGVDLFTFTAPNERPKVAHRLNLLLAGQQLEPEEYTFTGKDGTTSSMLVYSQAISVNGEISGIRGTFVDITSRKKTEERLQASEQRYRTLFETAHDAILLLAGGTIIECNGEARQLFQRPEQKLRGAKIYSFSPAQQASGQPSTVRMQQRIIRAEQGEQQRFDWDIQQADGSIRETEVSLSSFDLDGKSYVLALFRDMTERNQSRRALEEQESAWRAIFEHAPYGIVINRLSDGVYLDANPAFECYGGRKRSDILGKSVEEFLVPEQLEQSRRARAALLSGGSICNQEAATVAQDGTTRNVLYSSAVFQASGEPCAISMFVDITERKEMEDRLRHKENVLSSFFRAVPVGLAILKERCFLAVNEQVGTITGYAVDDLLNRTSLSLYETEEEYRRVGHKLYDKLWERDASYVETRFKRQDGSLCHVSLYAAPLDHNNPEAGAAVAIQDITERTTMLQSVRDSEYRYRALFESGSDAIFILKNGMVVDCNNKSLEMFRCTRDQFIGLSPHHFSPPTQPDGRTFAEHGTDHIDKAQHGIQQQFEWIHSRLDGTTFDADVRLGAVELSGETCVQAIIRDITDWKKTEGALRESEFRFRSFFNTSPEGILLIDFQGLILDINKAFLQESGYALNESIGKHFREFVPSEDQGQIVEAILSFKSGVAKNEPLRFSYIAKDGTQVPVMAKGWLVVDEKSTPLYLGVFIHNLSKELALADEKAALEKQVIQSQRSEAIGTLAGGIAHDFNNILGGIIGYTELAILRTSSTTDGKIGDYLRRVLEGSNRAKDLVQQILRFSRHAAMVMEPINLVPVIKESIYLLRSTLPSTISIRHHLEQDVDRILGDPTQIHQVVMNLGTNALHAMKENGGQLTITLKKILIGEPRHFMSMAIPAGEYLHLQVGDTGCGMPPAVVERVFEPYFTTKKINEGTGLGMAVVQGIIKSHQGLIEIESTVGSGTKFDIYLPITQENANRGDYVPLTLPMGRGERVLLVDDEPFFLEVIRESLQLLGYQVTACGSSRNALRKFSDAPCDFDLLITDQTMPEMTGVQLVREVRRIDKELPIILCTGYSEIVSEQSASYYGINHFLMKPVNTSDLALSVAAIFTK